MYNFLELFYHHPWLRMKSYDSIIPTLPCLWCFLCKFHVKLQKFFHVRAQNHMNQYDTAQPHLRTNFIHIIWMPSYFNVNIGHGRRMLLFQTQRKRILFLVNAIILFQCVMYWTKHCTKQQFIEPRTKTTGPKNKNTDISVWLQRHNTQVTENQWTRDKQIFHNVI